MKNHIVIIIFIALFQTACGQVLPGAYQTQEYLSLLDGKRAGIVANPSSLINNTHLVDSLLKHNINIRKVFAPEHGFRGKAEAGAHVKDGKDPLTGLSVLSLYGKNKKPNSQQLAGIDIMIFDLQGVGARFYTYISTLKYMMEACAENDIPLIVLDRPNPNSHYVDGPIMEKENESFVGLMPIPIVYGMTDGELALMINGENWNSKKCDLTIIELKNYDHQKSYNLQVKPSPNLPNFASIYLYPSLCLFEGTKMSIGRGTDFPFQVIGFPDYPEKSFQFTPKSIAGVSANPKFKDQVCYGLDLRKLYPNIEEKPNQLNLKWLIDFYNSYTDKDAFFIPFFEKLSGTSKLRQQIIAGESEESIRESWQADLDEFKLKRENYLLY
ncbi:MULTISPECIES: DUF1343 domain-containing protein [unclassified Lentimicrobium]|uniref:exo-beta-N-acetylmuramidase NamZ family protein n=1 Tax=unclassified Lentimicrobium TaxID=2677434 RepID=UPI0015561D81|nr:DUF1343 domain-containing protein [Lentimicrobium sp. S6]NPD84024.1 DUF1343 domain-containing protein [Lentimicrobium sp. L6]